MLGQQQKDDDHIHKVDGAHEAQQVGGPVGDAGEDGQNQQSGAEQQPEDRVLDLDFCLAHAAQDVPRCDQAAEDQADADKRLVEHFYRLLSGYGVAVSRLRNHWISKMEMDSTCKLRRGIHYRFSTYFGYN